MSATPESLTSLRASLVDGARTVESVVDATLDRIAAREPSLHAFNTVVGEPALTRARQLDRARAAGQAPGPAVRRPGRGQGQHLDARRADDGVVAHPAALRAAVRRHRGRHGSRRPAR